MHAESIPFKVTHSQTGKLVIKNFRIKETELVPHLIANKSTVHEEENEEEEKKCVFVVN
jgi:hypothetical protein